MQVDWFTIIAQALNFLILLWFMKRFLFKPILGAIDEREKRIADQVAAAEAMKIEAQKQRDEYEEKNEALEKESAAMMDATKVEVQSVRQKLLDEAREAAEDYNDKHQKALKEADLALSLDIQRRTREEVLSLARYALTALAGTSLEVRIVELFNDRLRDMGDEEVQTMKTLMSGSHETLIVRTGLDLNEEQKTETGTTIKSIVGTDTHILFESKPELVSGIELIANGFKVAWSMDDYLAVIEGNGASTDVT
jgi:F-type H+-transporting ATPase subunit b